MRLIEREDAESELEQALSGALRGEPGVIIVEGSTGAGKTALLRNFIAHAGTAGARVFAARGAPTEKDVEFGVLFQLLNSPTAYELECAPIAELAENLVASESGRCDGRSLHRICNTLLRLAVTTPLVICVDDVQYADAASVSFLLHLSRRLDLSRVLMVLTESDQPTPPFSPLSTQLSRQPYCEHVRLQPLTRAGVAAVLAEHMDTEDARRLAPEAERLTGGNPALVHALALDSARLRTGEVVPGDAFARAYPAALHSCGETALRLTRTLALLPPNPDPAMVAQLNGLSPAILTTAVRVLSDAGLLSGRAFRHPAARDATLRNLDQAELAVLHREIAAVLFTAGAPAQIVAEHLALTEPVSEPWASEVLADTAEQIVLEASRPEVKMRRLLTLDRQGMAEADRARVTSALLSVEWRMNPRAAVRRLPELTAAILGGQLRDHRALTVYQALLWTGKIDEAEAVLTTVRTDLSLDNARNRSALAISRELTSVIFPSLFQRLRNQLPDLPVPDLDADTAPALPSTVDGSVSRLRRNLHAGTASLNALAVPLALVVSGEQLDGAELSLGPAASHEPALVRGMAGFLQAEDAYSNGYLAAADSYARSALTQLPIEAWGVGIAAPLSIMLSSNTVLDRLTEVGAILDAEVPPAAFESIFGLRFLLARSRFFLARGNYRTALAEFTTCGQIIADWGLEKKNFSDWRLGAAEASLRLGDSGEARRLLDEELQLRGPGPSRSRGAALRLLALSSRARHREPLLREAITVLLEAGDRIDVVRAYGDLSRHHRRFGSRQHSEAAARIANDLQRRWYEMPAWSEPGARAYDGDAPGELAALTRAELRVGKLAADGLRNQDISRRLAVTVSTVEQHLTSIYRKLNVKGRAQLQRPWFTESSATAGREPVGRLSC